MTPVPLKIREKVKIDPKRKRFGLINCERYSTFQTIVDRDAEPVWSVEKEGRHVARVATEYARAVCDALNLIDTDHNALLALKPAKRQRKQREQHPDEGGSENP